MFDQNYQKITEEIVSFVQKTLKDAGFNKVIIGLSGGIDSTTVCFLLVKAIGPQNVLPVILPYGGLHKHAVTDAKFISAQLKIPEENICEIDIQKTVEEIVLHDKKMNLLRKGNIMSRVRMIYLYDLTKKHHALVCGTENKTEYLLGYFTRFGDEASDFEPLRNLYKTEVKALARHLQVPQTIIEKSPTAGLWLDQTDEEEFGFSYEDADRILHFFYDKKLTREEITKKNFDTDLINKVLDRATYNRFKHHVPYLF